MTEINNYFTPIADPRTSRRGALLGGRAAALAGAVGVGTAQAAQGDADAALFEALARYRIAKSAVDELPDFTEPCPVGDDPRVQGDFQFRFSKQDPTLVVLFNSWWSRRSAYMDVWNDTVEAQQSSLEYVAGVAPTTAAGLHAQLAVVRAEMVDAAKDPDALDGMSDVVVAVLGHAIAFHSA